MCFDHDSQPPIAPIAGAAVDHVDLTLDASDGNRLAAFAASSDRPSGAGMLILPDVRGLHRYYEELALRFAENGIDAIAIDYFGRTAGPSKRGEDFDYSPHTAQTTWDGLQADMRVAVGWLRRERAVRSMFSIGFCFGGRLSFLTGTVPELSMAGGIGFYGWPVGPRNNGVPAPADLADRIACPVLGVFGGDGSGHRRRRRRRVRACAHRGRRGARAHHLRRCAALVLRPQVRRLRDRVRRRVAEGARLRPLAHAGRGGRRSLTAGTCVSSWPASPC